MKIVAMTVGKTAHAPLREAIARYADRLPHYAPFELRELPDVKTTKGMTEDAQKAAEGERILQALAPTDCLVLLDERGRELTSRELAKLISDKMVSLPGRLVFVIGGPYGFSPQVYARADMKVSLSKMTFPHELAKLMLIEQLYRSMTILRGEPYHHD